LNILTQTIVSAGSSIFSLSTIRTKSHRFDEGCDAVFGIVALLHTVQESLANAR